MFNRALQVKVIKTKKSDLNLTEPEGSHFEEKATFVAYTVDNAIKKVGLFAIGYVVVDAVRQVLVAKATRK